MFEILKLGVTLYSKVNIGDVSPVVVRLTADQEVRGLNSTLA